MPCPLRPLALQLILISQACGQAPQEPSPRTVPAANTPAGAGPAAPATPARDPGTAAMAERLERLAENGGNPAHPYDNAARAAVLREAPQPLRPGARRRRRARLAQELLRAGESTAAAAELEALLSAFPPGGPATAPGRRQQLLFKLQLGVAHLRRGEQENCLDGHTSDSCLLPIRGHGIHRRQEGSRAAMEVFAEILERASGPELEDIRLQARWLLNLAAMTVGEHPSGVSERWRIPPEAYESGAEFPRFRDVAPAAGAAPATLSGGVVTEDLDGDGDLDVLVSSWGSRDSLHLFWNQGDGTFSEGASAAGLDGITGGLNVVHADSDGDGHPDVLVLRGGWWLEQGKVPNSLLRNRGDGTFADVTEEAGLLDFHPTQTAAWADYDGDGHLDLFVGNETFAGGGETHPCRLFHNRGDGTFSERSEETGTAVVGYVKAVVWGDVDNDGRPDLYVSRFVQPNVLLRNEGPDAAGRWRFRDVTAEAGVGEPRHSFTSWFFDFDDDGFEDLFVSGYGPRDRPLAADAAAEALGLPAANEKPRLYRNRGDGTFEAVTRKAGLDTVIFTMGGNFGDLDGDGRLDFYAGTGDPLLGSLVPNKMFLNGGGWREGAGTFLDVTASGGFGHLQKGHGVAFADLDGDGDQDVYAAMGGAYSGDVYPNALFENPGFGNRWVTLRLEGVRSNRSGIGTRLRLVVEGEGGTREIHRTVGTGGSFGSASLQQEIGLGRAAALSRLEVFWPASGERQVFENLEMDRVWRIVEGEAEPLSPEPAP